MVISLNYSSFEFSAFIASPIIGHYMRHIGKKRSMIIGLIIVSVGTIS
jgi:MFS family permease